MAENQPRGWADILDKATTFILVNMLWMVLAALIITLPLATAGLFATLTPWVHGQTSEPFRDFFGAMRRYARQSIVIFLGDIGVGLVVWINLQIFRQMNTLSLPALLSLNVTIFVAVSAITTNLYLWPLLVTLDAPLSQLVRTAAKLALLHPIWSILASLIAMVPLFAVFVLPAFIVLLGTFSTCALLASWGAWRVLGKLERNSTR